MVPLTTLWELRREDEVGWGQGGKEGEMKKGWWEELAGEGKDGGGSGDFGSFSPSPFGCSHLLEMACVLLFPLQASHPASGGQT